MVLTTAIEAALLGADVGLWGKPLWRGAAYQNGAFWPGLLDNWRPNFPAQPLTMWITHAALHAGPGHLAGNMALLLPLGEIAAARLGGAGFVALYLVSALGGALGYALLGPGALPMVGASGALHGLMGAWLAWEAMDRRAEGLPAGPVGGIALGVAGLNLISWVAQDGLLAWEAHLGGFLAGWAWAVLAARPGPGRGEGPRLRRRARAPRPRGEEGQPRPRGEEGQPRPRGEEGQPRPRGGGERPRGRGGGGGGGGGGEP